jgi:hypothetical protein
LIKNTINDEFQNSYQKYIKDIFRMGSKSGIKKISIIFVQKKSLFLAINSDKQKLFLLKKFTSCFSEIIITKDAKNAPVSSRLSLIKHLVRDLEISGKIPICLKKIY